MPLTDKAIKAALPGEKTYKLFDGEGLYLEVSPSGGKWWRFKYRVAGVEKRLSFGVYPRVSLQQARAERYEARRLLMEGNDPARVRKLEKLNKALSASNSFQSVAKDWHESWSKTRTPKHAAQVWRRLEADVLPKIGHMPVTEIKALDIVALAKAVEKRGANDLARRAIQICGQVFRYAIGHGMAEHNPARDINPGDVLAPVKERNYARVDTAMLPKLLQDIDKYTGHITTRLAIHLLSLTFVRTSELIHAQWHEFDWEAAQWRIPAERMKMASPHIVPLSRQTLEVLQALRDTYTGESWLFPGKHDHEKPMSNNAILFALYHMGYKGIMTGHGFRGVASTHLHEMGFEHAHIELQLAHQERDRVSAAYNWATYIPQRTAMMQAWADFLDQKRGKPISLPNFLSGRTAGDHFRHQDA